MTIVFLLLLLLLWVWILLPGAVRERQQVPRRSVSRFERAMALLARAEKVPHTEPIATIATAAPPETSGACAADHTGGDGPADAAVTDDAVTAETEPATGRAATREPVAVGAVAGAGAGAGSLASNSAPAGDPPPAHAPASTGLPEVVEPPAAIDLRGVDPIGGLLAAIDGGRPGAAARLRAARRRRRVLIGLATATTVLFLLGQLVGGIMWPLFAFSGVLSAAYLAALAVRWYRVSRDGTVPRTGAGLRRSLRPLEPAAVVEHEPGEGRHGVPSGVRIIRW